MQRSSAGYVPMSLILNFVLGFFVVALGGVSIWAFVNYIDQKDNVDAKITAAVKEAKTVQQKTDETAFAEQEKQPVRQLVGPADLGAVSIDYPKTWSVYIERNGEGGEFHAILHPGAVPAAAARTAYALHVNVLPNSYESVLATYSSAISAGQIKATPVTIQGENGVRLEGAFTPDIQGAIVLLKLRDKTIRIATDSKNFINDFDNIVLKSLKYNR